jgi:hypothetical protein
MAAAPQNWTYVVTDIEADGAWPGPNSMLSFASVAIDGDGRELGVFEAVLETLPGALPNPDTLAWFATQPGVWEAATTDPQPPGAVMEAFATWVAGLPGSPVFAAFPLAFDGPWIDYYLRRFTAFGLTQGPYEEHRLFPGAGLCIRSYAAALLGQPVAELSASSLDPSWLGNIEHTHKAIDDARGYAHLLGELMRQARTRGAG